MSVTILVITEQSKGAFRKPSFEVISEARRIADRAGGRVAALVIGSGLKDLISIPARYGADTVLVADNEKLENYSPDYYRELVIHAVQSQGADIILMPATTFGRDLAPRIAARLEAGLASDCLQLFVETDSFEARRPMYAGKAIAKVSIHSKIKMATLRPNIFPILDPDESRTAQAETIPVPELSSGMKLKEFRAAAGAKIDLTEAQIIITGGRGMRGPEHFKLLEDLADLLGGAVGATRAVVDGGWRPHSEQVGQTGKTVSPNLYMLFGASGSIQHWAGMSGAKFIVAVNKDPEAPIIAKADYSIIGDLFEVVPALTEEIRKLRG
jgi:electron transfer flavoprotein alpha subunit